MLVGKREGELGPSCIDLGVASIDEDDSFILSKVTEFKVGKACVRNGLPATM